MLRKSIFFIDFLGASVAIATLVCCRMLTKLGVAKKSKDALKLCSDEVLQDVETPPTCVLYHPGFRIIC